MNEMISAGVELMLIGMGIVFAFLAMLVVMVSIMSWMIKRFVPEQTFINEVPASASIGHTETGIIAAISVAVHQYRCKNN